VNTTTAKPEHEVCYSDLTALLRKHGDSVSALEMLAIAANMVGKIIAMQDQRTVTSQMAMEIVSRNIEVGNQQVLHGLQNVQGNS
jgi:hypothetical protein